MGFIAEKVGKNAELAVKRAAIAADQDAVLRTPVDTGRARANWVVSYGNPVFRISKAKDRSGDKAIAQGRNVIGSWNLKLGTIYITNSLPYIVPLDTGLSDQAPNGMTRFAIEAARDQLRRARLLT